MSHGVLEFADFSLTLPDGRQLLHDISLRLHQGQTLGIVGESGSGKTVLSRAIIGAHPAGAQLRGELNLHGTPVIGASAPTLARLRQDVAAMVFQNPRASLNPMHTIGDFLTETLVHSRGWDTARAQDHAANLLQEVGLPPERASLDSYPHQLSGGMLQRVVIAAALAAEPALLICDEPTTALDLITQERIGRLLLTEQRRRGMAMVFVTHDLQLAAAMCDTLVVMKDGTVVETGPTAEILTGARHPYTRRLVEAGDLRVPEPRREPVPGTTPALQFEGVSVTFRRRRQNIRAVDDVTLAVEPGTTFGVVGESGSGKSTLVQTAVGLLEPGAGTVRYAEPLTGRGTRRRLARARQAQIVFQDPFHSLDPRLSAAQNIARVLRLHGLHRPSATMVSRVARAQWLQERVRDLLRTVELSAEHAGKLPRELSGGQLQRVAIARALAVQPTTLILDEATSALDVSVQAGILALISRIQAASGLTVVMVSHDLNVVARICDRVAILKDGAVVESGPTASVLNDPREPYTRRLLAASPSLAWRDELPPGDPPAFQTSHWSLPFQEIPS